MGKGIYDKRRSREVLLADGRTANITSLKHTCAECGQTTCSLFNVPLTPCKAGFKRSQVCIAAELRKKTGVTL